MILATTPTITPTMMIPTCWTLTTRMLGTKVKIMLKIMKSDVKSTFTLKKMINKKNKKGGVE
jgi:hypothetical protein